MDRTEVSGEDGLQFEDPREPYRRPLSSAWPMHAVDLGRLKWVGLTPSKDALPESALSQQVHDLQLSEADHFEINRASSKGLSRQSHTTVDEYGET